MDEAERGQLPPHDLAAEEAALGAALIQMDAARAIVAAAKPADYYSPANRHIAHAIAKLIADGHPVDVVTVAGHLRSVGTLDDAGGPERLHELQNATPAISRAGHYATTIRGLSIRRRILYASADIAKTAYETADPAAALRRAAAIVSDVGDGAQLEDITTLEVPDIAALLATDLEPEEAVILTRTDGQALLYAGKMHMFQAEPTSGKSWIALFAVLEVLRQGGTAIYIDFEDTAHGILRRLLQLGGDPATIERCFAYVQPIGGYGEAERARLHSIIDDLNPDLVIIDGVGEALTRDGLSEDKATDVVAWIEKLPRPIARTGAAVVMIDHVVKDREQQGRWARGSSAKLGVIDGTSYQLKVRKTFSRTKAGEVHIVVAKDRPGGVGALNDTVGVVKIEPSGGGDVVRVSIEPYTGDREKSDEWKPTHYMADVSGVLAESASPLNAQAIKALLPKHKKRLVQEAIVRLEAEGHIDKGAGRGAGYTLVKPYVDPDPVRHLHSVPPPPTDDDFPGLFDPDEEF